jgi:hypothetical protein
MKKIIIIGAIVLIGLLSLAVARGNNDIATSHPEPRMVTATSTATSTTPKNVAVPKNSVALGEYANGTYTGYIRNLSKTDRFTFTIDFVQSFGGKEAFLAAAADAETNPNFNWDIMKDRYPTYAALVKGVRAMTEIEFDALYASYQSKTESRAGIIGSFPDGYVYIRNKSTAVRVIAGDKQLGSVTISNSSTQITMDDLYLICHNPTPAILDAYYRKYNAGVTCENPVQFTISKGLITGVKIIYRP